MKFSCPKCKSKIEIQKTFNKKIHVSCKKCGIEDLIEFSKNIDEAFLEFLSRFDQDLVTSIGLSEELKDEGIIRAENEIKDMIGNKKPDKIIEEILFSKKDYISQYKVLKNPEPKMGSKIEEVGLDESITEHLKELKIEQFYKFQEEVIQEIIFGENVVIEAPTASGKTEAFLIPVIQRTKKEEQAKEMFLLFLFIQQKL